jgi:Bor protein
MSKRTLIATGWLLLAAATGGCYHQYLRVTRSDQLPEKEQKTVWSYAWGLVHSRDSVTVCGQTRALDQVEVKANFGMAMLGILTLGIVVPRRMIWYCSTPRECPDDIGLATAAGRSDCSVIPSATRRRLARGSE